MVDEEPGQHKAKGKGVVLSGVQYDALKTSVMIAIPGLAALYFGLAQIWGLPKAEEVVGSAAVLTTFLGLFAKQQKKAYDNSDAKYDAVVHVDDTGDKKNYEFDFGDKDVEKVIDPKKEILVKVNRPNPSPTPELPLEAPNE